MSDNYHDTRILEHAINCMLGDGLKQKKSKKPKDRDEVEKILCKLCGYGQPDALPCTAKNKCGLKKARQELAKWAMKQKDVYTYVKPLGALADLIRGKK